MAKFPSLSRMHPEVNPQKISLLSQYILEGPVLDIGCGNGLYGLHCANLGHEVIQLDIQDRRNQQAKHLPLIKHDAQTYIGEKERFSNIIAFDIMEHLDDEHTFLQNVRQLLRAGGRVFISVPNEDNSLLNPAQVAHIHFTDKTHRREYSETSVCHAVRTAGLMTLDCKAHYNKTLTNIPLALAGTTVLSKLTAKLCRYQLQVLCRIGFLQHMVVADWFLVGEK